MMTTSTSPGPASFLDEVEASVYGDAHLDECIQCGSCGGSCPSAADMDHTPRALFALIREDEREAVLQSNTPWHCVSCYYCMVRCPQQIKITDLMYALKQKAVQEGYYKESSAPTAADFSETFVDFVEHYGRSFELGLASRYHLRHHPLDAMKMAPMGLGMLRRGRMDLKPRRIRDVAQLQSILNRAKEIGGRA